MVGPVNRAMVVALAMIRFWASEGEGEGGQGAGGLALEKELDLTRGRGLSRKTNFCWEW